MHMPTVTYRCKEIHTLVYMWPLVVSIIRFAVNRLLTELLTTWYHKSVASIYARMLLPPGIRNDGNACFASSVLQCLFNQELFRKILADIQDSHAPACKECKQGH